MIGIILAGGASRRFGEDKATYMDPTQHQPWVRLMLEKMMHLSLSQIYIAASTKNQQNIQQICQDLISPEQIIIDQDPFISAGPLGGLYSVSQKVNVPAKYLIVPTDYPNLSVSSIKQLMAAGTNRYAQDTDGRFHYTVACISFTPEEIAHSLHSGNRRLFHFYQEIGASPLLITHHDLQNHNYKY